ncbi:AMP-dependent synthetase/ligase [Solicola sp. PLA-1-18]|uniref:AMP-dependent synthetase/ligase n=1 Tax=Solicola sp. PLA-1-18 TaxID=3380532 RepID=UPI003B81366D
MLSYATPATYRVPGSGNLTDDVLTAERDRPGHVTFSRRTDHGWADVTAADFAAEVRGVARGLLAAGIGPGDRVGLLCRTRYEWTLVDYAIWWVGAVTVPIYESSSADQVAWVLSDSGAVGCVVEDDAHRARVEGVRGDLPALEHLWVVDDGAVDALVSSGSGVDDAELESRRSGTTPDALATVIYTSGTTGRPKGCRLTHANLMFEAGSVSDGLADLVDPDDAATLLFLPLAHVFARVIQVVAVRTGTRLGHTADVSDLVGALGEFKPSFILAVPRVFEKVYNGASQKAQAEGRGRIFDAATDTAIAYSRALDTGSVPLVLRVRHRLFDRLVYGKLRAALGGRATHAIAGGAPLGERLAHFFRGIGVPVLEGYGLTETTAAVTVNLPHETKIGTVGRPVPGTEARVGEDGELLFRGDQVFSGYWQADDATAEVLDADGWFHTGDLGEIDGEGFVRVTGRKKEIIVTAGGKNIAPAVLEDRMRAHAVVSQCMVVGDGKPFVAALVTLDAEAVAAWADSHGRTGDLAQLAADPDVLALVQAAVDDANSQVSRAESVRKFHVLAQDWTEEAGYVTPTLKLKRQVVLRDFVDDIEALYL